MTLKFGLHDPWDASDRSWVSDTAFFFASNGSGSGIAASPTPVVSTEVVKAQAAQSGPGGPGSVVAEASGGGLTINLIFDSAAMAAPASFRTGIEQAAALLSSAVSDKITINIKIDYNGTGGGAAAGPDNGQWINYSIVRADLVNNAAPGDTSFNALPTGSTMQGQSSVAVWNAQLKLWGLLGANDTTTDDGSATFATNIDPNLLVGVALHELTHAMGRVPYGPQPDIFDFYRFTSLGARLFSGSATAPPAYFSLDTGNTKLADYGQTSDPSDFLNSGVQGPNDPFNEFYTGNSVQQLTAVDLKQLDALGFRLTSTTPVIIQTDGNTSLVQVGSHYFLYPAGGSTGPELQKYGSPVYVGQLDPWSPIGAIQVSGGYDIAWKNASTGQFTVWATDDSGNRTATLTNGAVAGNSTTLESFETTFHQDLNGDGIIGIPSVVIQTDGDTSLVQAGSHYFLYPAGGSTGPELQKYGSPVYVGQLDPWSPIGAIQVSGGYDIAWKNASTGQFTVWAIDDSGNRTATLTNGAVAGNSTTLESFETTFHQDLNGDGIIGIPSVVIQTDGNTSLVQVGSHYFLYPAGGSTGPELQKYGSPVYVGQLDPWSPIGAIQVSGGYDIAWKNASTGQFTVWAIDDSGNRTATLTNGAVAGNSTTLESFETTFHQDLNGDGITGIYAAPGATLAISSPLSGVSGSATIGAGATLEISAADSASATFSSSTGMLKLDNASTFSGLIFNFAGNGTLSGSDQIDLKGFNFTSVHDSYSNGVLTVTEGTNTTILDFNDSYTLANFKFASDGSGGTIVYDPPASQGSTSQVAASAPSNLFASAGQDSFVFAPDSGRANAANLAHALDNTHLSKTVFANLGPLTALTQEDSFGHMMISDAGHNTITIQHMTTAQLLANMSDFHFV